jgi:hypothetical protein
MNGSRMGNIKIRKDLSLMHFLSAKTIAGVRKIQLNILNLGH